MPLFAAGTQPLQAERPGLHDSNKICAAGLVLMGCYFHGIQLTCLAAA